jgi:hypothetical protein
MTNVAVFLSMILLALQFGCAKQDASKRATADSGSYQAQEAVKIPNSKRYGIMSHGFHPWPRWSGLDDRVAVQINFSSASSPGRIEFYSGTHQATEKYWELEGQGIVPSQEEMIAEAKKCSPVASSSRGSRTWLTVQFYQKDDGAWTYVWFFQ